MEKNLEKESDFVESSSPTVVESSVPEKMKSKKRKKGCNCKGFSNKSDSKASEGSKSEKKLLENSEWFKNRNAWAQYIRRHREDLRLKTPVVDDKAPRLNMTYVYDLEILKSIRGGLRNAFEMNQTILRNLHEANILPGKTDTFTFNYAKPMNSNYSARKEFALCIYKENQMMLKTIKNAKSRLITTKEYAEDWKKHEKLLANLSQFPLWWKVKKKEAAVEIGPPRAIFVKQHITEKSAKYPDKRPRVFLEVSIRNVGVVGRMVVMLFSDHVPMTVKNFLAFCDPKAKLTYKGNLFYLIFQNYYCQTGDVVENKGFGGTSIYGPYFSNEESELSHGDRGMLTMYSKIPNRNGSQFLITFRKLESLDGKNVVFGKIIKGLRVLEAIENMGTKKTGRPKVEIYISDCDEI